MASWHTLLAFVLACPWAAAYTWPNPQMEALDALRYEQDGPGGQNTAAIVLPCDPSGFVGKDLESAGRINAADWLRTGYHDMATHNATAGTGGLDASIQFAAEQSRPENAGDSFSNTIPVVQFFAGRYVSLADAIALGAIVAVEACGGNYVPYRGGRVDATQPGPPGVPEPQDTLASHTAAFARQGFNAQEMIQLVACGHSLGGVQHTAFPTVSQNPGTDNNTSGNEFFDTTFEVFDNKIATDYVSGNSIDPLVVGPNITTRSDARIFGSDGNVTIKALASSNDLFKATCATLFARMLDTVPNGVQLTEEVLPLPAKPDFFTLTRNFNGTLTISISARFWDMQEDPTRVVNFAWAGSSGTQCDGCIRPMTHDPDFEFAIFIPRNITSLFYNLPGGLSGGGDGGYSKTGLLLSGDATRFWFEVTEQGSKTVLDQNGAGFALDTAVLLAEGSCLLSTFNGTKSTVTLVAQVGVVKGTNPSSVSLEIGNANFPNKVNVFPATLNQTGSASNTHIDVWSVNVTDQSVLEQPQTWLNIAAEVNGRRVSGPSNFESFLDNFDPCPGTPFGPRAAAVPAAANNDPPTRGVFRHMKQRK